MATSLISLIAVFTIVRAQDFGYEGIKGPSHWGEQYNSCFGKFQSPIDINSLTVKHAKLPPLIFNDSNVPISKTVMKNNGHTVMVSIDSDQRPTIFGGPLSGTYEFAQLHFHWGENDTMGSEDFIDGHSFPMELHMVFYKKQYRNVRSAMENSDGLTVLAFFFHLDDEDNKNYIEITELLPNVSEPETSTTFTRLKSLKDLILNDLNEYYTYHGSLTTPPCSEVVTWIDFKRSIPLSHAQIEVFRTIQDNEGHHLTHNFRPIQPLGDRDVYLITTLDGDDGLFGKDDARIDEPPQNLDHINSEYKQSTLTESTTYKTINNGDNNGLDDHPIPEQRQNDIETTTTSHRRPFHRPKGSDANYIAQANLCIFISFCSILRALSFKI
ncbi:carbonic anhydrase 7-like [Contarinia nasturtii]|uniref:carbonic anhydrase 7-like n=1 Tax=Contarinia nasturtii TaxID=265458 RepID=UPI0012D47723|nr:carbonic anhydrase 7-like [Contarinia nasturtii]XP_031630807.1 carbonic anhydrase 7-like [Contarinia nasturtii]